MAEDNDTSDTSEKTETTTPVPANQDCGDACADSGGNGSEAQEPIEADDVDEVDPAWEAELKRIAKETPEVRWRHSSKFSDAEDRIIAAGLASLTPEYKIAQIIRCHRVTLAKHIEETPILAQLKAGEMEIRRQKVQEGIDNLINMNHPQAVLWAAEKLLPDVYGDERKNEDEDDSRLVIGAIPEEGILEGDEILKGAREKPPEVGLSAMLDERLDVKPVQTGAAQESAGEQGQGIRPAAATKEDQVVQPEASQPKLLTSPVQPQKPPAAIAPQPQPSAPPTAQPPAKQKEPEPEAAPDEGFNESFDGGFGDGGFGGGGIGWM